jgi:hypothetical protein
MQGTAARQAQGDTSQKLASPEACSAGRRRPDGCPADPSRSTALASRVSPALGTLTINIKLEYKVKTAALCTLKRYLFFFSLYI